MPNEVVSRTTLLAATEAIDVWLAPPVPMVISRIPLTGSATPAGVCGANRS
jgi:hypothetical protein